jgi:fructose-1-phosphate kinase PfkB-like protein
MYNKYSRLKEIHHQHQVLAFMKSYFPKAPVVVVAGGLAANCTDEQYVELLEQMAPIAEQVAEKLSLQ